MVLAAFEHTFETVEVQVVSRAISAVAADARGRKQRFDVLVKRDALLL